MYPTFLGRLTEISPQTFEELASILKKPILISKGESYKAKEKRTSSTREIDRGDARDRVIEVM